MDLRALRRLLLIVGIVVLIASVITARRVHTEERAMEVALIAAIAAGAFLTISGLIGVLTEPPAPAAVAYDETAEPTALPEARGPSLGVAIGVYLFVLALLAGIIVGIAARDAGAGIQTFTFGLILGAIIFGIGYMLGHRPVEE